MIQIKSGNIFDSEAQVLVCPVNCVGVMGAGLAKQFAERIPGLFEDYKRACYHSVIAIPGDMYVFDFYDSHIQPVMCVATKSHWRVESTRQGVERCLQNMSHWIFKMTNIDGIFRLNKFTRNEKITSLAMPKIGCGLGGLSWEVVKPLAYKYLEPFEKFTIEIYE